MRLIARCGQTASTIRAAIAFLTRLPVGHAEISPNAISGAAAHFPFVGTILGTLGCLVWLAAARLHVDVRAWLVVVTLLLATGAFHEDGLADTADALGGASNQTKLFEILKDSRIGTFGATALVCALVLRANLLAQLLPMNLWSLIAAQTFSRLAPVLLMAWIPYVTPEETSRSRGVVHVGTTHVMGALSWTALLSIGLVHFARISALQLAAAALAQSFAVVWLAFRFTRRAGGLTGDFGCNSANRRIGISIGDFLHMQIIALRHPPPITRGLCAGRFDFPVRDPEQYVGPLLVHQELTHIERIYSSPAARCRDLAQLIAQRLDLPLQVDARLHELDFGDWEGRTWNDIEADDHERFQAWANDWQRIAPPNGECIAELERRVSDFMDTLATESALGITHAGPIRAMRVLCQLTSWDEAMSDAVPYVTPKRFTRSHRICRSTLDQAQKSRDLRFADV